MDNTIKELTQQLKTADDNLILQRCLVDKLKQNLLETQKQKYYSNILHKFEWDLQISITNYREAQNKIYYSLISFIGHEDPEISEYFGIRNYDLYMQISPDVGLIIQSQTSLININKLDYDSLSEFIQQYKLKINTQKALKQIKTITDTVERIGNLSMP